MLLPSRRWTQSPIAAAYDRTPLHAQYQWYRTAISKCVDRLDEPRPTGFRFLGELKSSRGSVALCGPTWVGRTHAGVRCGISATRNSLRSQVPQKSKSPFATFMPSPNVHTPATRCRRSSAAQARARRPRQPAEAATPSNYFLCRDPGAGFAPSCLGECAIAARHEPEHRTMWYRKNVGGSARPG